MSTHILCVCLGNICRSPTAEAVLRAKAEARGIAVTVDGAGTGGWHIGKPPYGPMIRAAADRGYDLTALRARQVSAKDFDRFDLILAMDGQNLADLQALDPGGRASVALFDAPSDVPDPYYTGDFDGALTQIEQAADRILDQLVQNASAVSPKAL